jgi:hypothetical protein
MESTALLICFSQMELTMENPHLTCLSLDLD